MGSREGARNIVAKIADQRDEHDNSVYCELKAFYENIALRKQAAVACWLTLGMLALKERGIHFFSRVEYNRI